MSILGPFSAQSPALSPHGYRAALDWPGVQPVILLLFTLHTGSRVRPHTNPRLQNVPSLCFLKLEVRPWGPPSPEAPPGWLRGPPSLEGDAIPVGWSLL